MANKIYGINPLQVEGSNFETGYGHSKFVKFKINNKEMMPIFSANANVFGSNREDRTKEKVFCQIKEEKNSLNLYARTSGLNFPRWIGGAPTFRIGEGVWGPQSGLKFKQIKNYKKIQTSIEFNHLIKKGFSDFSYDIWLTKETHPANIFETTREEDVEIMITLNSNFKFPWTKLEENENFIVLYEDKNKNPLARDKGHCICFIQKKKINKFDILELINLCSKYLKKDLSKHYLRSFDLINEFAKNTETIAKITKLRIDLIEK